MQDHSGSGYGHEIPTPYRSSASVKSVYRDSRAWIQTSTVPKRICIFPDERRSERSAKRSKEVNALEIELSSLGLGIAWLL